MFIVLFFLNVGAAPFVKVTTWWLPSIVCLCACVFTVDWCRSAPCTWPHLRMSLNILTTGTKATTGRGPPWGRAPHIWHTGHANTTDRRQYKLINFLFLQPVYKKKLETSGGVNSISPHGMNWLKFNQIHSFSQAVYPVLIMERVYSPCRGRSWCPRRQAWTWSHIDGPCGDTTATCRCPARWDTQT